MMAAEFTLIPEKAKFAAPLGSEEFAAPGGAECQTELQGTQSVPNLATTWGLSRTSGDAC